MLLYLQVFHFCSFLVAVGMRLGQGQCSSVEIDMYLETSMFLAGRVSDFMVRVMFPGYPGVD
jgi:hypothetical protein